MRTVKAPTQRTASIDSWFKVMQMPSILAAQGHQVASTIEQRFPPEAAWCCECACKGFAHDRARSLARHRRHGHDARSGGRLRFYEAIAPPQASADERLVQRQALAGLLWSSSCISSMCTGG
jgi:hypothetical protein